MKSGIFPFVVRLLLSSVIRLTLSRLPSALRWRIWATCGCAAARSSCACRVQPKPLFRLLWCRRRLWTLARQSGRNLIQLKGGGEEAAFTLTHTHKLKATSYLATTYRRRRIGRNVFGTPESRAPTRPVDTERALGWFYCSPARGSCSRMLIR